MFLVLLFFFIVIDYQDAFCIFDRKNKWVYKNKNKKKSKNVNSNPEKRLGGVHLLVPSTPLSLTFYAGQPCMPFQTARVSWQVMVERE